METASPASVSRALANGLRLKGFFESFLDTGREGLALVRTKHALFWRAITYALTRVPFISEQRAKILRVNLRVMFVSVTWTRYESVGAPRATAMVCRRPHRAALVTLRAAAAATPGPDAKSSTPKKPAGDKKIPQAAPSLSPEERAARVQQLKMRVLLVHRQLQVAESSSKDDPLALWRSVAHDMATPAVGNGSGSQATGKNGDGKSSAALREELEALKAELAALDGGAYTDVLRSIDGVKTAEQRIKEHEHKIQEAPKLSYPKVVFQDGAQQPKQKQKPQRMNLWKVAMSWIYRNEPVIEELEREIESI